mmetsp:Transcript_64276/g.142952  ORF Transcript_64276/g.142952 Transcript_64276/m.142952 type:complete len:368 (+) Transcript_64276:252-1355(+)
MPPRRQRLVRPVRRVYLLEQIGALQILLVLAERDEVWVRPLRVEEVQCLPLLRGKDGDWVSFAPRGHDHVSSRLQHPGHLFHVPLFVRHVFARLASPDHVETVVLELHVQGVHHLEAYVGQALFFRQLPGSFGLLRREGDAEDLSIRKPPAQDPGRSTDAAADVEDLFGCGRAAPVNHLVCEVDLCLLEVLQMTKGRTEEGQKEWILLAVAALLVHRGIGAHVDVLSPVVLQDTFPGPLVVRAAHRPIAVGPFRRLEPLMDPRKQNLDEAEGDHRSSEAPSHGGRGDSGFGRRLAARSCTACKPATIQPGGGKGPLAVWCAARDHRQEGVSCSSPDGDCCQKQEQPSRGEGTRQGHASAVRHSTSVA